MDSRLVLSQVARDEFHDPNVIPWPLTCRCGREYQWSWWPGREGIAVPPHWRAPLVSPCEVCGQVDERARGLAAHADRVLDSGLPPQLRGWSLRRREVAQQGETQARLAARLRPERTKRIGVTAGNTVAIAALESWHCAGWIYLEGEVGRGKSVLAAAWVSDALEQPERVWEGPEGPSPPGTRTLVGRAAREVIYVSESEMLAREKLSWKGDHTPLYRISQSPILVLDDLGQCARVQGATYRVPDWASESVERLVCFRYEHLLPTLFTSNLPLSEAEQVWGERVASRLRERCGRPLVVGGESWRDV